MTDKLELKSCHEVIDTVDVADVESIFHGKPIDPDILTVVMKDGKRLYCDEVCPVGSRQEEPVSGLDNGDMPIERWKQAVAAASNQKNYRSSKGLTETRDDYFVDGVQWADEHPKEEPVSESIDFEQELYKAFGQIKDFTLGVAIAKRFYDMGRKHNEPVSEELEKEIQTWADYFKKRSSEFNRFFFEKTARHFAEWQKQKMMKNAIDAVVHIDAGGYPYIPQIELYDYDKDIPLAKEGDKYKVILIKEE